MSYRPKLQLHPPRYWQEFEELCCGLWKAIWGDINTQMNGRVGQPQNGVDIFGRPNKGYNWAGVQCKGKENYTNKKLTKKEVENEVKKAKKFSPRLSEYTIATTGPKDSSIQEYVRHLTIQIEKKGWFCLSVCGWDDIVDLLYEHEPPIARRFYPDVFGGQMAGLVGRLLYHLSSRRQDSGREFAEYFTENQAQKDIYYSESSGLDTMHNGTAYHEPHKTEIQIPAQDIGIALKRLSDIADTFACCSISQGITSADAKLADAIFRVKGGHDSNE